MIPRTDRKSGLSKRFPLMLVGLAALVGFVGLEPTNLSHLLAQSLGAKPKFEVASIRPTKDCAGPSGRGGNQDKAGGGGKEGGPSPGRMNACDTVANYILTAYVLLADGHPNLPPLPLISGGPSWINSERYTIVAKSEGTPSFEMMYGPMMQALLEDRFKLKIHRETREVPVYALTVAKNGPKLTQFKEGSCTLVDLTKVLPLVPEPSEKPFCGARWGRKGPNLTWDAQGISLGEFSQRLGSRLDRSIIDKTGITGSLISILNSHQTRPRPDRPCPAFPLAVTQAELLEPRPRTLPEARRSLPLCRNNSG
jgi:uncharacterized protein (TIGR03435 family)